MSIDFSNVTAERALTKDESLMLCAVTAVPYPAPAVHGDLLTLAEFVDHVASGMLIDYDGYGIWSDGTYVRGFIPDDEEIDDFLYYQGPEPSHRRPQLHDHGVRPSLLSKGMLWRPAWATHVLWFNK